MADSISLNALGPFSYLTDGNEPYALDAAQAKLSGIYLFTIPHNDKELVHYVGETGRQFSKRLREHLFCYMNGTYNVYDASTFAQGSLDNRIWKEMLFSGEARRAEDFIARHREIFPQLAQMLKTIRLWLIPIDIDSVIRKNIEAAIARALLREPHPVCSFHEKIRYTAPRNSEDSILFSIENHDLFLGMPHEMST